MYTVPSAPTAIHRGRLSPETIGRGRAPRSIATTRPAPSSATSSCPLASMASPTGRPGSARLDAGHRPGAAVGDEEVVAVDRHAHRRAKPGRHHLERSQGADGRAGTGRGRRDQEGGDEQERGAGNALHGRSG
jgi:hypothetical protein